MSSQHTAPHDTSAIHLEPFASRPVAIADGLAANPPDNMYGGCSIQVFDKNTGAGNLSYTHGDANGFLNYANQFDQINFHYEDSGVEEWEYSPTYDDWQGKYGMDAVRAFYHSGHGGMDAGTGVFSAPMGAQWGNQDWASSNGMSLGDQFLRYLFWSTCQSLEVLAGQSPIRTWHPVNKGLRMIFGFQSTSVDSPDYGAKFFSKWNAGVSFSQAWQDASIEISGNQQVSSSACGSSAADAQNRLWNERLFEAGSVSSAFYWWRWAGNAPASAPRAAHLEVPAVPRRAVLGRRQPDAAHVGALARRYGLDLNGAAGHGAVKVTHGPTRLAVFPDGSHEVHLGAPDRTAALVGHARLHEAADAALRRFAVGAGADLVFDRATATYHAGARVGEAPSEPAVADVTLHYRQTIDGVPVVMGNEGHVRVTLDPAGTVVRIADNTRPVQRMVDGAPVRASRGAEHALRHGTDLLLRRVASNGIAHPAVATVPGTTEVGYRLTAAGGVLVTRSEIEVTTGRMSKRHVVEMPL